MKSKTITQKNFLEIESLSPPQNEEVPTQPMEVDSKLTQWDPALLLTTIDQDGIEIINARELHSFLEVKSRFNDWIRGRIDKYNFEEEIDFTLVTQKRVSDSITDSKEYFLSIDMAKELSLIENNEKGREARQYFITQERMSRAIASERLNGPALISSALIEAEKLLHCERCMQSTWKGI